MTTPPSQANVVILDTCVFSFIYGDKREAAPYRPHLQGMVPAVTFVTVGELLKGAYRMNWPVASLQNLQDYLREDYLVIPYDEAVAEQWARIQTAQRGRNYPENDAWIAACAITFGCTLLTHNRKDFHDNPGLEAHLLCPLASYLLRRGPSTSTAVIMNKANRRFAVASQHGVSHLAASVASGRNAHPCPQMGI